MSIKHTVGIPENGMTGIHSSILMCDKDRSNWRKCVDFKKEIENNGYLYSHDLEESFRKQMSFNGSLTLKWHIFKFAS